MIDLKITFVNTDKIKDTFDKFPRQAQDASISAMKSTGYNLMGKIRTFIESGGAGWVGLSEREKKAMGGNKPLYGLGKFVRYVVKGRKNTHMRAGFISGYSFSRAIRGIARKHEAGKKQRVPAIYGISMKSHHAVPLKMRGGFAASGFPMKRSTKFITIPRRPMVSAVFAKEKGWIMDFYTQRFWQRFTGQEKD